MKDRDTPTKKLRELIHQVLKEELSFELSARNVYPRSVCDPLGIEYRLQVYLNNEEIHQTTHTHYK